ncbi:hypothetical protein [Pseudoalteromonas denitrificans]|uniref:hypothetical protein n=1 Tax=Pseudoalteromonas denitrificans TaxID=43656 RepID=UPI001160C36F|nr:hypothetical protein [Pseudoalteromonas denitrificans]
MFIIIDHNAIKGTRFNAPNDLHRIDSDIVKKQMKQAGFKLVEEDFYFKNQKDTSGINVFTKDIRGKTDRFVYKFVKI